MTNIPTNVAERAERAANHEATLRPWIQNFEQEYRKGIDELMVRHERLASLNVPKFLLIGN